MQGCTLYPPSCSVSLELPAKTLTPRSARVEYCVTHNIGGVKIQPISCQLSFKAYTANKKGNWIHYAASRVSWSMEFMLGIGGWSAYSHTLNLLDVITMYTKMATRSQNLKKCASSTTTPLLKRRSCLSKRLKEASSRISVPITSTYDILSRRYSRVLKHIDPSDDGIPRASTVLWSTICFVAFMIFGGFAVGYPRPWMRILVLTFNSIIFVLLAILSAADILYHRKPRK
jgi:hypothetical protein